MQRGPIAQIIIRKLTDGVKPKHVELLNESHMHNVPKGSETHFKVLVVAETFRDLSLLKRHQMVNTILKTELSSGVHALSIVAKTPEEWEKSTQVLEPSPKCRGGFGK